jgi:hypothetical protein
MTGPIDSSSNTPIQGEKQKTLTGVEGAQERTNKVAARPFVFFPGIRTATESEIKQHIITRIRDTTGVDKISGVFSEKVSQGNRTTYQVSVGDEKYEASIENRGSTDRGTNQYKISISKIVPEPPLPPVPEEIIPRASELENPSIDSITKSVVHQCYGGDVAAPPQKGLAGLFRRFLFAILGEKFSIPIIHRSVLNEITALKDKHDLKVSPLEIDVLVQKHTKEALMGKNTGRLEKVENATITSLQSKVSALSDNQKKAFLALTVAIPTPPLGKFAALCQNIAQIIVEVGEPKTQDSFSYTKNLAIEIMDTFSSKMGNQSLDYLKLLLNTSEENMTNFIELSGDEKDTFLQGLRGISDPTLKEELTELVLKGPDEHSNLSPKSKITLLNDLISHKVSLKQENKLPFEAKIQSAIKDPTGTEFMRLAIPSSKNGVVESILASSTSEIDSFLLSEKPEQETIVQALETVHSNPSIENKGIAKAIMNPLLQENVIKLTNLDPLEKGVLPLLSNIIGRGDLSDSVYQVLFTASLLSAAPALGENPKVQDLWSALFTTSPSEDLNTENFIEKASEEIENICLDLSSATEKGNDMVTIQAMSLSNELADGGIPLKTLVSLKEGTLSQLNLEDLSSPPQIQTKSTLDEIKNKSIQVLNGALEYTEVDGKTFESVDDLLKGLDHLSEKQKVLILYTLAKEAGTVPGFSTFSNNTKVELSFRIDTNKDPIELSITSKGNEQKYTANVTIEVASDGSHKYTQLEYKKT